MAFNEHEESVSEFYSHIVDYNHNYNEGFLTFGIWQTKSGEHIPPPLSYKTAYDELLEGSIIQPDDDVLEVACGQGAGMMRIKSKYGCNIQGIDVSIGNVKLAKKRLRGTGIDVTRGSATRLPFDDSSFNCVICIEGGPHFKTRDDFFKEAYRVLKPGGRLLMGDLVSCYPFHELSYLKQFFLKLCAWSWVTPHENLEYDIEGYKQKLIDLGFKISKFQVIGDRVIPGYCSHNLALPTMHRQASIRGSFVGYIAGPLIDISLHLAFMNKTFEYILVDVEKPQD